MLENETQEHSQARLTENEADRVNAIMRFRSPVIYEVIRRQGEEELHRPYLSLTVAGVAAGVVMGFSVLTEALLHARLPDAPWAGAIERLGYTVGFIIVIMARLQLFTENTITTVLPICAYPTARNFLAVVRLWTVVLVGNLVGTLIFAAFIRYAHALSPDDMKAFVAVSERLLDMGFAHAISAGIVAGFLIACLVWVTPSAEGSEFWMILLVTYIIALGGFAHVVVGSTEAWFLVLNGNALATQVFGGYVVPAFIGNVIGGTGLFTLLAYTQVSTELENEHAGEPEEESDDKPEKEDKPREKERRDARSRRRNAGS